MRHGVQVVGALVLLGLFAWNSPLLRTAQQRGGTESVSTAAQLARRPLPLSVASKAAASDPTPPPAVRVAPVPATIEPARLVVQPLPRCSVVFFHHLEKTGGTTLRNILQRHAQVGEFDLISFVNRFDKLQFQMVLHRLHTLLETPGGLDDLRLAVEIHIGAHLTHPYFMMYTLPDLLFLRSMLRARGARPAAKSRVCTLPVDSACLRVSVVTRFPRRAPVAQAVAATW